MSVTMEMRRTSAERFAKEQTMAGKDWQEIQFDLINSNFYAPLFADMSDDSAYDLTMEIIRAGEDAAAEEEEAA